MPSGERIWDTQSVDQVASDFEQTFQEVNALAVYARVGEDYELEHEALLRKRRGPLDTLHLFVFLESTQGHTSPDALARQERLIDAEMGWLGQQSSERKFLDIHTVVLPFPIINGRELRTMQQYREEFHMEDDEHRQIYPPSESHEDSF